MLYIPEGMEILDTYDEEQLIEEAIKVGSSIIDVSVEKFISYDEKHCEYYTETVETYTVNLMEYVSIDELLEHCKYLCVSYIKEQKWIVGKLI